MIVGFCSRNKIDLILVDYDNVLLVINNVDDYIIGYRSNTDFIFYVYMYLKLISILYHLLDQS